MSWGGELRQHLLAGQTQRQSSPALWILVWRGKGTCRGGKGGAEAHRKRGRGVWACVRSPGSRGEAVRKSRESVGVDNAGCAWVSCLYQEPRGHKKVQHKVKGQYLCPTSSSPLTVETAGQCDDQGRWWLQPCPGGRQGGCDSRQS